MLVANLAADLVELLHVLGAILGVLPQDARREQGRVSRGRPLKRGPHATGRQNVCPELNVLLAPRQIVQQRHAWPNRLRIPAPHRDAFHGVHVAEAV